MPRLLSRLQQAQQQTCHPESMRRQPVAQQCSCISSRARWQRLTSSPSRRQSQRQLRRKRRLQRQTQSRWSMTCLSRRSSNLKSLRQRLL